MNPADLSQLRARQPSLFSGRLQGGGSQRIYHEKQNSCTYAAYQVHMCSMNGVGVQCYSKSMKAEQKIIAAWIERTKDQKGWSYAAWAKEAGVGAATTITRALKEDYESVTSVPTLHSLARAAQVPSILDFLEGRAFSAAALRPVLTELLQLSPKRGWTEVDVEHFAQALEYGLGLAPVDQTNQPSQDAYEVAARAAADRFRSLDGR